MLEGLPPDAFWEAEQATSQNTHQGGRAQALSVVQTKYGAQQLISTSRTGLW